MSFPDFYNPNKVGDLFRPDVTAATLEGQAARMAPSSSDQTRVLLLLVDVQVDFVHPEGSLSVPGAVDDTRRTIEWILAHAGSITTIGASLDSHIPIQIFFPTWWQDADGNHPQPYTVITSEQVDTGQWVPLYDLEWSRDYVHKLETKAKKALMIWPYHTLIGTAGHNLMPALYEAVAYHTAARQSQPVFVTKGSIPKTEHYSMLEPEVKVPHHPQGTLNQDFLDIVAGHDKVFITGQAKSHCVLETVTSIMNYFADQPEVIGKLNVLMDGTSSVAHPEIDFEAIATEALELFERDGLTLTDTTEAL